MASAKPKETDYSQWPVIVHTELTNSSVSKLLIQKRIKLRTSSLLSEGMVLFPKAKVVFLILELKKQLLSEMETSDAGLLNDGNNCRIFNRIEKLKCFHGIPVVLLLAPLFTSKEFKAVSDLQIKYLSDKVSFVPTHDAEETVAAMIAIADLQTPPKSDLLAERFRELRSSLLKPASFLAH
ncbi:uncharacterized protein LOC106061367 [Biomphalaria glabrata]|uniref:Uncharacterized protein LOC106061367 n=1 Tax=Biomphalaria glabrata TaxID=6526 RepID=A0A9U8E796_BIOGL|nr:uncharacterized protein LOC106061367 [Biomphalaria glabrata]